MPDERNANAKHNDPESSKNQDALAVKIILLAAVLAISILVVVAILFVNEHSERIRFVTVNVLSLLIILLVAMQAYIYRRQWAVMEEQRTAMKGQLDAMETQSGIMSDSLAVTRKGVEIAERSLILGTKAYVGINYIRVDLTNTKRIVIKLANTGKLPAEDVKVFVEMLALIYPKWADADQVRDFIRRTFTFDYGRTKLFPIAFTIDLGIGLSHYLSDQELALISKEEGFLIIRGYAEYGDGFEKGQRSAFALRYSSSDDMWTPYPIERSDNPLDKWIEDRAKEHENEETNLRDPL